MAESLEKGLEDELRGDVSEVVQLENQRNVSSCLKETFSNLSFTKSKTPGVPKTALTS